MKVRLRAREIIILFIVVIATLIIASLILEVQMPSKNSAAAELENFSKPHNEYIQMAAPQSYVRKIVRQLSSINTEIKSTSDRHATGDLALLISRENRGTIDSSKPMVALTFDDGPYSPVTDRILNVMEKYNSRCTFFVVGNRVWRYYKSVQRASSLGCEIGSHTFDHTSLTTLTQGGIFYQINESDYQLWYYTNHPTDALRPPGGSHNSTVDAEVGKPIILWSLDTKDWKTRNAQTTLNTVLDNVSDGDIVLMHDLYPSTADAVEKLVPALIEKGYQIVTVKEMAIAKGVTMKNGTAYYHF